MEAITIHPKSKSQAKVFEGMAKALNIPFEKKIIKDGYDPEFVAKIKKGERDKRTGNFKVIKTEDLWK
jgi:hypothetical protein